MKDHEIAALNNYLCDYLKEHIDILKNHQPLRSIIASATMNFMLQHNLAKDHVHNPE